MSVDKRVSYQYDRPFFAFLGLVAALGIWIWNRLLRQDKDMVALNLTPIALNVLECVLHSEFIHVV
jgi:hypothetical protein